MTKLNLNSISILKTEYLQRKVHVMSNNEEKLSEDIRELKQELASKEAELDHLSTKGHLSPLPKCEKLTTDDISRYSRQMILPELRPAGQRRLLSSSALIVGCGGNTQTISSNQTHTFTRVKFHCKTRAFTNI